jgi:hypothetical protein
MAFFGEREVGGRAPSARRSATSKAESAKNLKHFAVPRYDLRHRCQPTGSLDTGRDDSHIGQGGSGGMHEQ